jgi:hypothetical protein
LSRIGVASKQVAIVMAARLQYDFCAISNLP